VRQQFPSATAANCVTDPIHDLAACVFGRTPSGIRCGHERFQAIPFRITEIGIICFAGFHLDRLGGRLFKRALHSSSLVILSFVLTQFLTLSPPQTAHRWKPFLLKRTTK
jgi:hypothetical protein